MEIFPYRWIFRKCLKTLKIKSLKKRQFYSQKPPNSTLTIPLISKPTPFTRNVGESLGTITRKVEKHSPTFEAISLFWLILF